MPNIGKQCIMHPHATVHPCLRPVCLRLTLRFNIVTVTLHNLFHILTKWSNMWVEVSTTTVKRQLTLEQTSHYVMAREDRGNHISWIIGRVEIPKNRNINLVQMGSIGTHKNKAHLLKNKRWRKINIRIGKIRFNVKKRKAFYITDKLH